MASSLADRRRRSSTARSAASRFWAWSPSTWSWSRAFSARRFFVSRWDSPSREVGTAAQPGTISAIRMARAHSLSIRAC